MGIEGIAGIGATSPLGLDAPGGVAAPSGDAGGRFGDLLESLGGMQAQADAALTDLAVGGEQDLHEVVLAVEMESIAFDLAVQIRNRMVDAYQEIFRMSV